VRKGKHVLGIALRIQWEHLIHRLQECNRQNQAVAINSDDLPTIPFEEQSDVLPPTLPTQHYHISINSRQKVQLVEWLHKNHDDPAVLLSIPSGLVFSKV